jgi:hypothetical protein
MAFDRSIMKANTFGDPVTLTDAATVATNAALGTRFLLSTAAARTIGIPTNPTDGKLIIWEITNTDGSARTQTFTSTAGGLLPMETVEGSPVADTPAAVPIPAGETAVVVAYYSASLGYWVPISIKASV